MEMSEGAAPVTIEGMDGEGWSNSAAVKEAPQDVQPEVSNVEYVPGDAGWSNAEPHQPTVDAEAAAAERLGIATDDSAGAKTISESESKVVASEQTTAKSPRKATARKSASRSKG